MVYRLFKLGEWQDAYDKASAFVGTLTTSEKISLITAGDAGNFSAMNMLDSATNPLAYDLARRGKGVGAEFKGKGVHLAYGPTLQPLVRSAWCGRTGESYGLDSYHAGIMAGAVVKGIVQIGDKAFHETYLAPFYDTVKNGMGGAMCGMNKVNGTYSCESQDLLAKYLKVELGFPGIVHADVSAQKTGISAANAGMDLSSSSHWSNGTLGVGLTNGSFTSERLDDMAIRNLMGYYHLNQNQGYPTLAEKTEHRDVRGNHSALARKYASESVVLLKNTNNALPLKDKTSISIFGTHAAPRYVGANTALSVYDGEPSTMQGHMATVGGSAMGSLAYVTTPVQLFVQRAAADGFMLRWWLNDTVSETSSGMAGGEGADRTELYNTEQDTLVTAAAENCNNTNENVTGVLYAGALGQESGNAIDDVLFGSVNPSGRLVHTIAKNESDYNPDTIISDGELELNFTDGNFIDYKYFDQYNITPRYEYGYGLSYTTCNYSETVSVESNNLKSGYATGDRAIGGREDLWDIVATAKTSINNTGSVAGAEVAQLYISFPAAAGEPVRQLRGFDKTTIQPGEGVDVTFDLPRRDLSVWGVAGQEWEVVKGEYTLYIGASSRDFKATATLTVA
ncbi:hypothetical protein INS49_001155 [Diaporthe citri]|uniref:uncharacterized protein n=1 Tax=Diaporthe citri TaxID=83186 RepID=UPI001C81D3EB|nr:uncharacterized protein INS49_001155 [Diaporthe citri]KAG6366974.1 hypothetical protein INS49_001155 [Diaporthe citri]